MVDNYFNYFMKERQLYAAYERAKIERGRAFYDLTKQGYSRDEIYATSRYRKAYNRSRKAFRVWALFKTRKK